MRTKHSNQDASHSHERESVGLALLHPCRDVALAVQHAPDINVLWTLDVEHEAWKVIERPEMEAGEIQFVSVARRSGSRMVSDVQIALLQSVNKAQRCVSSIFAKVVGNGFIDVPVGKLTRNDWLGRHSRARDLAALRTRLRNPSK